MANLINMDFVTETLGGLSVKKGKWEKAVKPKKGWEVPFAMANSGN